MNTNELIHDIYDQNEDSLPSYVEELDSEFLDTLVDEE
jgi:hypothetical protein